MAEGEAAQQVAAILVNWNGFEDSVAALESLRRASPGPGLVVVVDNGSTDGSGSLLAEWAKRQGMFCAVLDAQHPDCNSTPAVPPWPCGLVLVLSRENLGFGGGVNLGTRVAASIARPTYILLLNNDATVAPDFLPPLLAELAQPRVACATGLIYYADRRSKLWYAGGRLNLVRALGAHRTRSAPSVSCDVEFVSGCFAAIKLDVFQHLGLLPEVYFLYSEDVELSFLLRRAGYRLRLAPRSVAYHKVNAATRHWRDSPLVAYLHNRNRLWFARRNLHGHLRALALAWLVPTRFARAAAELGRGRIEIARKILRGTWDGLFADPHNSLLRPR